jgi:hypothetical protein
VMRRSGGIFFGLRWVFSLVLFRMKSSRISTRAMGVGGIHCSVSWSRDLRKRVNHPDRRHPISSTDTRRWGQIGESKLHVNRLRWRMVLLSLGYSASFSIACALDDPDFDISGSLRGAALDEFNPGRGLEGVFIDSRARDAMGIECQPPGGTCAVLGHDCPPPERCVPYSETSDLSYECGACASSGVVGTKSPCESTLECHESAFCFGGTCLEVPLNDSENVNLGCRSFMAEVVGSNAIWCELRCDPLVPFDCRDSYCIFSGFYSDGFVCGAANKDSDFQPSPPPGPPGSACESGVCEVLSACEEATLVGEICGDSRCCTRVCDLTLPDPDAQCFTLGLGLDYCVPYFDPARGTRPPVDEWEARLGRCLVSP